MKIKLFKLKKKFREKSIRELLYRSFEEKLKPEEKARLEKALVESEKWKKEYQQVKEFRELISQAEDIQFSPSFSDKVLERWAQLKRISLPNGLLADYLAHFFIKIVYIGGAAIVVVLVVNLLIGDILSSEEILLASDSIYETLLHLPLF